MAISSGQLSISTTAVEVSSPHPNASRIQIHNMDNTNDIYIGNGNVTTSNGFRLMKQDSVDLELLPTERIYAITVTGTVTLSFFRQNF